jgi:hypothetical protein
MLASATFKHISTSIYGRRSIDGDRETHINMHVHLVILPSK